MTITDDGEEPLQDSESFWVTITNEAQAPIVEPIADAIVNEDESFFRSGLQRWMKTTLIGSGRREWCRGNRRRRW